MTHGRIKHARKQYRMNCAFWVTDLYGRQVRLDTALEVTNYGNGVSFVVCDAEGLFFDTLVTFDVWGQDAYNLIAQQIAIELRDDQRRWQQETGTHVIPVQKLSTGKTSKVVV